MDWASRAVLAWRLSNSMDGSFCVSALEEALARFGKPDIFNTDQGSRCGLHRHADRRRHPHLDGWTRPLDRQRVHRTAVAEHEGIYLKGYADGREAHAGIACWIAFCNRQRSHQALGNGTPMAVWREGTTGPPR